ncbi:MAG: hypothetical protein V1704_05065 [Candidatus Vogelbacteria bacterium]
MIGPPPDEICLKCGALVPHEKLPEYDHVPGHFVSRPERYESGLFKHSLHCSGKPTDQEARARLREQKKRLRQSGLGQAAKKFARSVKRKK